MMPATQTARTGLRQAAVSPEGRLRAAALDGFTLHAATRAGGLDADGREALLRYVLRGPRPGCALLRLLRSGWNNVPTAWCVSP